jgi:hypothetical protein
MTLQIVPYRIEGIFYFFKSKEYAQKGKKIPKSSCLHKAPEVINITKKDLKPSYCEP